MNKEQIISKGKKSIASIAFLGLSLNLHGTIQELEGKDYIPFNIAQNCYELAFLIETSGFNPGGDRELGFVANSGNCIGRGGYGSIFEAIYGYDEQQVVLKYAHRGSEEDLENEFRNSFFLLNGMLNEFRAGLNLESEIRPEIWEGMKSIVCSLWRTPDGALLQKRIMGLNLLIAIEDGVNEGRVKYPYNDGNPVDGHGAIWRAMKFFYTLATVHRLGYIVVDLSCSNIVLDPSTNFSCCLIDWSLLTSIGGRIPAFMLKPPPAEKFPQEYWEAREIFFAIENKEEEIERVVSQMQAVESKGNRYDIVRESPILKTIFRRVLHPLTRGYLQVPTDEMMAELVVKYVELDEQKERLEQEKAALCARQEALMPPAHPSYDIYLSSYILQAILFGKLGLAGVQRRGIGALFLPNNFENVAETAEAQKMYSPEILAGISEIITAMRNPDPGLRPSAMDIADALRTIGGL
ncbi:MAG: hypothetical protein LBD60_04835 [Puniceicoccales bacterium]|jgi:serine/threonine protein kinase|nr:hypothetical protein [Puniceicoccales bacterium]